MSGAHVGRGGGALEVFAGARGVDVEEVERELKSLWKQAAEQVAERGRPPVTRIGTVNWIVLTRGEAAADRAAETLIELSARHPGRLLVVAVEERAEGLRASISAHCHLGGGDRQVCSEEVRIVAGGEAAGHVTEAVAPLLVPDLPAVLWIPGAPEEVDVDPELLTLADRVLVDAHAFPDAVSALERLGEWSEREGSGEVLDLAWLRLERWRGLVAQLFQEPACRKDLGRLDAVEVDFLTAADGAPEGLVEALYFAAWVSARLGFATPSGFESTDGVEVARARHPDGRGLAIRLAHRPRRSEIPGDLLRVALGAGGESRYEIERDPDREVAEIRLRAARSCPLPVRVGLASPPLAELICRALEQSGRDPVYREALTAARALARVR